MAKNSAPVAPIVPAVQPVEPPAETMAPAVKKVATIADAIGVKASALADKTALRLDVKTETIIELGWDVDDALKTAKGQVEWTPKAFVETINFLNATFREKYPDSETKPDAMRWWATASAVSAASALQIPDVERVGVKRINMILASAFEVDKNAIGITVRQGWAEWLKTVLPLNVSGGSMSQADLTTSVKSQEEALFAADPKNARDPGRKAGNNGTRAAKAGKTQPGKPSVATVASKVNPPAVPAPGKTTPAVQPVESKPAASPVSDLAKMIVKGSPAERLAVAKLIAGAMVQSGDVDAMMAIHKIIAPTIRAARDANKPKLAESA